MLFWYFQSSCYLVHTAKLYERLRLTVPIVKILQFELWVWPPPSKSFVTVGLYSAYKLTTYLTELRSTGDIACLFRPFWIENIPDQYFPVRTLLVSLLLLHSYNLPFVIISLKTSLPSVILKPSNIIVMWYLGNWSNTHSVCERVLKNLRCFMFGQLTAWYGESD
jgi:hypothetical protein